MITRFKHIFLFMTLALFTLATESMYTMQPTMTHQEANDLLNRRQLRDRAHRLALLRNELALLRNGLALLHTRLSLARPLPHNLIDITDSYFNESNNHIIRNLQPQLTLHQMLDSRPDNPEAIANGFVDIAAKVPFDPEAGTNIDPDYICSICTDTLQKDSLERTDEGRVVQLTCSTRNNEPVPGHVMHASCFNKTILAGITLCPECRAPLKPLLSTIIRDAEDYEPETKRPRTEK